MSVVLNQAADMGARASVELALLWLRAKDPIERDLYERMYEKIVEYRDIMEQNHINKLANVLGKMMGG